MMAILNGDIKLLNLSEPESYPLGHEEINNIYIYHNVDFPGGSDNKESACNVGDPGSIPGSEKSPGEGNNYPLQYSCLENSRDRGNWLATDHGVAESQTRLSD